MGDFTFALDSILDAHDDDDEDDILDELSDWLDDEIEDNQTMTIAKAVDMKSITHLQALDKKKAKNNNQMQQNEYMDVLKSDEKSKKDRDFDLESGQKMSVYVNGIKHILDGDEEIILHKGWNHVLFDFAFNDMNQGSFQIIDFNEKSEITDLYWRYSPPPMSLILQFNHHNETMEIYEKLKTAKQKRYGIRVELAELDNKYLANYCILQSQLKRHIDDNKQNEKYLQIQDDDDIIDTLMNSLSCGDDNRNIGTAFNNDYEFAYTNGIDTFSQDRLLDNFANGIVENINKSNIEFEKQQIAKDVHNGTRKYQKLLAEYSPSQMIHYDEKDKDYTNTTEMFDTGLNVPSTLQLKGYPYDQ